MHRPSNGWEEVIHVSVIRTGDGQTNPRPRPPKPPKPPKTR
jgi:hypothetical protein